MINFSFSFPFLRSTFYLFSSSKAEKLLYNSFSRSQLEEKAQKKILFAALKLFFSLFYFRKKPLIISRVQLFWLHWVKFFFQRWQKKTLKSRNRQHLKFFYMKGFNSEIMSVSNSHLSTMNLAPSEKDEKRKENSFSSF